MKDLSILIYFLLFLLVSMGIFLLIRSIILWYWRINDIVNNQLQQTQILRDQTSILSKLLSNLNKNEDKK